MQPELSIIVPLYNEQDSVELMYEAIVRELNVTGLDYEILFIDDGSKDETFRKAAALADRDRRLRVIRFRKNYGQTPAMAAGIDNARGKILVTMDGDLQNDPADIPNFVQKIREGYPIVVGWRHERKDKLLTRKIPSVMANWLIGKVTGVPIKDNGCSLKAYQAELIKNIPLYSEMHRFIPAMTSLAGARVEEIKVRHHARKYGQSKYGLSRIYKVLLDLLTIKTIVSFSSRPLAWFAMLAVVPALIGIVSFGYAIVRVASGSASSVVVMMGASLLFVTLAIFLMLWGVLGELIYSTGDEKLDSPARFLAENVGFQEQKSLDDGT